MTTLFEAPPAHMTGAVDPARGHRSLGRGGWMPAWGSLDFSDLEQPATAAACLAGLPQPAAIATPARDLTRREARDIVLSLLGRGTFTLKQAWTPLRFGSGCGVVSPRPETRIAIEPGIIDGVQFVARRRAGNQRRGVIDNLDVRLVVMLCRLATMLRTKWGVTEIHDRGIGHGGGAADDCHNTGRAIDFAGVVGVHNGVPYTLDILADWGNQPVPMPDGNVLRQWPEGFTRTTYRINPQRNPLAHAIFKDVYDFAARECTDTNPNRLRNGPATTLGAASRFVIHPDHPNARLRAAHRDHMHFQIGPTGKEQRPP